MGDLVTIDTKTSHKASFKNRETIEKSTLCGCFYCVAIFTPENITKWTDDGQTAKCPFCHIDSVVDNASGTPITKKYLLRMHEKSFGMD